jgi:hypothetical protein
VSFSSLEAGHASSAGAADYPLRTLLRDTLEREMQRELEAWLDRAEGQSGPSDRTDDDLADWLRSDDSPLLLHNVEEFVLDPEAHLRAIADRVEGPGRALQFSGGELVGTAARDNQRDHAEELRARLRTMAELDAERIVATPRRRGTPKGKTRTHYMWLVSPDRDISNSILKSLVLEIIRRRWPGARVVGYIHRDTGNTHLHIWLSAETLSGKKISVTRATPSGDAILDKYPDLDEEVARSVSRYFGDPSIFNDHIARKLEWVHWRERFEEALRRGERPPVMPHRARHDYDWVGERRAVSDREGGESQPHSSEREKAAPVPRVKSLMGALELWGKTAHLDAKVKYRQALLDSLDVWRDRIDYPIEGVKQSLERKLEEAERDYEGHRDAFDKTLENRKRIGYPELKYPLYNSKQIAEMTEIARLTRDADLLRYVRSYTGLDKPTDGEGQVQEVSSLWRAHVEARLEVLERADILVQVSMRPRVSPAMGQASTASDAVRPSFDGDHEIVKGWLYGGWTHEQMRDSLPCFETEAVRLHASRYLKAREFFMATGEALARWREGGLRFVARPALEEPHLDRIAHLVSGEGARISKRERALLLDLAASAGSERDMSLRETTRLIESSLTFDAGREVKGTRPSGARGDHEVFRPHDDEWVGRLAGQLTLIETEALALAASGDSRNRLEALREDVYTKRALMDLTRSIRAASGMARDVPAGVTDSADERARDSHLQVIADGLRSRGDGWKEWQVVGLGEFKHILPKRERERAERVIEGAKARLETERRAESLERLEPQLESAAQFYVRAAYRDEGLEVMREPGRLKDHVRGLAERFSQVALDASHDPERLGLGGRELEERAGRALSDAVERFGREERDSHELGRLEARMVLACAVRSEAAARRQRFADHAHFHEWNYETLDGRGSTSLCEIWLAYNEEIDPAARLVAQDAEQHIVRSINEVHVRLTEAEATHSGEAEAATRAYEARADELSPRGVTARGPIFEPGELTRLEEAAVITRDHELIALVARCEEEMYGAEHAVARAMGRALRAVAVVHAEHALPERFEHPVATERLERLPGHVRDSLSELLARHRNAREAERGTALSFREGLDTQSRERAGESSRTLTSRIRPLLTEAEAGEIFGRVLTMNKHERQSWERMTMHAKVAVEADGPQKSPPSLHEWARQNTTASSRGSEYQRGIGDTTVLSHREARAIIRQQEKELGRDRPTPSRGR